MLAVFLPLGDRPDRPAEQLLDGLRLDVHRLREEIGFEFLVEPQRPASDL